VINGPAWKDLASLEEPKRDEPAREEPEEHTPLQATEPPTWKHR